MQRYIHDPDFEVDYIEEVDYDCYDDDNCYDFKNDEEYYGERLSAFTECYMEIKELKMSELEGEAKDYILWSLRNMISMMEEVLDKDDTETYKVLKSGMVYIVFKTMNTSLAKEYMTTHALFREYCRDLGQEVLETIEEYEGELWKNTRIAVEDFLYEV